MEKAQNKQLGIIPKILYPTLVVVLSIVLILNLFPLFKPFTEWLDPPIALAIGLIYALIFGATHPSINKIGSKWLLQYSVVGLGFGMNLHTAIASGSQGMIFTIVSVVGTLFFGWLIGSKLLRVNRNVSRLISAGTAICGGSAIAAVLPIIKAKEQESSIALGTIFILNALALFIFPTLGHWANMGQEQFGTWAAIAIHDTSSVVGAGAKYGEKALAIATTVKLTRALWIIPLTLFFSGLMIYDKKRRQKKGEIIEAETQGKKKNFLQRLPIPLFIIYFIIAILINTYLFKPYWGEQVGAIIGAIAKKGLTLSLFFIGASLTKKVIVSVGPKAMLQGILLWLIISIGSFLFVYYTIPAVVA